MNASFIVPIYNTDYRFLRICINSILRVLKNNHQLIIIDDASDRDETLQFIERCETNVNFNLKVVRNRENYGVCYSLNKAIRESSNDLIAPVDHDDLLDPRGVFLALRFQDHFKTEWLYTDEAQVDEQGYCINNFFKPVYSKQLLRSVMYINHLQLFSRDIFDRVGGYSEGLEGSQDHDLALRMSEVVEPHHVEAIAYQWRIQSDTQSRRSYRVAPEITERSMQALHEHYERLGYSTNIQSARTESSTYRIRVASNWSPIVSLIIPCRLGSSRLINGEEINLLEQCLQSIRTTVLDANNHAKLSSPIEVVLVLNHDDDTAWGNTLLQNHGLVGLSINDQPDFHFSRKCNLGAKHANGEILVFLNDDVKLLTDGWVNDIVSLLTEEDVASVGGMLLNSDGTVQSCGDRVGWSAADHYVPDSNAANVGDPMQRYLVDHETCSVTGAFFCCRRKTFWKFDGFSLAFPNSYQDVDFCLRARKENLRCLIAPSIRLIHFESSSRDPTVDPETLRALRLFHYPEIVALDEFQLWRYQKIPVRFLSITGLLRLRSRILQNIKLFIISIARFSWRRPRNRGPQLIR